MDSSKLTSEEKETVISFLDKQLELLKESEPYTSIEIDFECACADGEVDKVKNYLNTVSYLTKYPDYIRGVIDYVNDINPRKTKSKKITKVLELLSESLKNDK